MSFTKKTVMIQNFPLKQKVKILYSEKVQEI